MGESKSIELECHTDHDGDDYNFHVISGYAS